MHEMSNNARTSVGGGKQTRRRFPKYNAELDKENFDRYGENQSGSPLPIGFPRAPLQDITGVLNPLSELVMPSNSCQPGAEGGFSRMRKPVTRSQRASNVVNTGVPSEKKTMKACTGVVRKTVTKTETTQLIVKKKSSVTQRSDVVLKPFYVLVTEETRTEKMTLEATEEGVSHSMEIEECTVVLDTTQCPDKRKFQVLNREEVESKGNVDENLEKMDIEVIHAEDEAQSIPSSSKVLQMVTSVPATTEESIKPNERDESKEIIVSLPADVVQESEQKRRLEENSARTLDVHEFKQKDETLAENSLHPGTTVNAMYEGTPRQARDRYYNPNSMRSSAIVVSESGESSKPVTPSAIEYQDSLKGKLKSAGSISPVAQEQKRRRPQGARSSILKLR